MANTKIPVELSSTPGIVDNSNATAITIDSSEQVGIGTTSINNPFSFNTATQIGDVTEGVSLLTLAGTTQGSIFFADGASGSDAYTGYIEYNHSTNFMSFGTGGGTERMRIDSSGNVGIATTDPKSTLEVKGTFGSPATSGSSAGFITRFSQSSGVGSLDVGFGDPYSWLQSRASNNYATNFALALNPNGGNVSIRTTASTAPLNVQADGSARCLRLIGRENGTDDEAAITFANADDSAKGTEIISVGTALTFYTGSAESMRIDSSGNLLVGATSGTVHLVIGGTTDTARVIPATDNVGYVGEASHRWQAIYAVNGSIQTSDEREKTEIKETNLGLDFIKDLKPVSYKWIDGEQQNKSKDEREHQGLIAQQVAETVEKHGIDKNTFGGLDIQKTEKYDDFHGMSYDQFIAPLIKAIQEQQAQIEALQSEINELKNS